VPAAAFRRWPARSSGSHARSAQPARRPDRRHDNGGTFIGVLRRYAKQIEANGGRLMLAGVAPKAYEQISKTGLLKVLGEQNVFPAGSCLFEPMLRALRAAKAYPAEQQSAAPPG
jgi:sulfate permease, SulP family